MRLNCPSCGAQYEVPVDVIPAEGRDVQCSSCGITWFQAHPDHASEPEMDLDIPPADNEWVAETPEPVVEERPEVAAETTEEPAAEETEAEAAAQNAMVEQQTVEEPVASNPEPSLQETLKQAVRKAVPEEVENAISEEVETRIDETPLGDFEAELDAQLSEREETLWETPQDVAEPEVEPEVEAVSAEPEEIPEEAAAPLRRSRRRDVDPEVADVLRAEAAHEAEARLAEEASLETQQEFGLETSEEDETTRRAGQARARMARMRGLSETPPVTSEQEALYEAPSTRRNLLPDIEEINSTLRATEDRQPEELPDGRPSAAQRRRGGSRLGFGLGIALVAGMMFVYARPDVVIDQFPPSDPAVTRYVDGVDNTRIWLDVQMTKLMLWLDGMASEQTAEGS